MNYLILGVNGMAGHMLAQYLIEKGHNVTGFAKQKSMLCETIVGDALYQEEVHNVLQSGRYDVVVNCIGILNKCVDAKPADGIYINAFLPHFLSRELNTTNTKLIHISTDCVFEGTKGRYNEMDPADAISMYGRSKALGEVINHKDLTIRTSLVGPEIKKDGIGLFHWFMSQPQKVSGYARVVWSGVTTLQLARSIEEDSVKNVTGLYHLVNNSSLSKYELLNFFNQYCREKKVKILKNEDVVSDKSLINTRTMPEFAVPSYEQMVREMAEWMKQHPALYQQYGGI